VVLFEITTKSPSFNPCVVLLIEVGLPRVTVSPTALPTAASSASVVFPLFVVVKVTTLPDKSTSKSAAVSCSSIAAAVASAT